MVEPPCIKTINFVTDDYYDYYDYDDNNCITNGGEKLNEPCVFPFVFKGKTYNACPLGTKGGQRKGHIVIRDQQGIFRKHTL